MLSAQSDRLAYQTVQLVSQAGRLAVLEHAAAAAASTAATAAAGSPNAISRANLIKAASGSGCSSGVDVAATTSSVPGGAVAKSIGEFAGDGFLRWALASGK